MSEKREPSVRSSEPQVASLKLDEESIKPFSESVIGGIAEAIKAMTRPRSPEEAIHKSNVLDSSVVSYFGEHTQAREIISGRMSILGYLDENDVVILKLRDASGKLKEVQIGETPTKYHPSKGGGLISEAGRGQGGDVNDYAYLMTVSREGDKGQVRYLSHDQLDGVSVAPHDNDIRFNFRQANTERPTQTVIQGTVESAIALR